MAIYEYICDNCNHTFEAIQKMTDEPLVTCPACDQDAIRRLVSATGFRLKGKGWYETDFKSNNQKNLAAGESASSTSSTSE